MIKRLFNILKAAIISMMVAFLFVAIISFASVNIGKEKFEMATYLLQLITVDEAEVQTINPILEGNMLINYPTYASKYATLKIESINLELPIYYGANYTILKSGIAHDSNSYFPRRKW